MSEVLYVTSFNRVLYDSTGKRLLKSFLKSGSGGDILATYEGDVEKDIPDSQQIIKYNLDDDSFLQDWLEENKDIIPVSLGGDFPPCKCHKKKAYTEHNMKCPNSWFNRRTSQWFRKIAALNYAIGLEYKFVVFVDCDCLFKGRLPEKRVLDILKDYDVVYHLGKYRPKKDLGVESGLVGYQKPFFIAKELISRYKTKQFKEYYKWDDSYLLRKVIEEDNDYKKKDIVLPHKFDPMYNVVEYGPFGNFITHNKGVHHRMGVV